MGRMKHISAGEMQRVYDAFLRGYAAMTAKVEMFQTGAAVPRNIPRLASIEASPVIQTKHSWTYMLAEVGVDGAASPIAYLRKDYTVHGVVRDYSVEHINNLSLLVGNGDILTVEIKRDVDGTVRRHKPIWTWGGRDVSTHDYLTISAPLMTQVYRFTRTTTKRTGEP